MTTGDASAPATATTEPERAPRRIPLWLRRLGIEVRIVDKTAEPGTTSRALAVQARTLEFYRQTGLAEAVTAHGREVPAANLWVKGRRVARAVLGDMGAGISPYPYALIYPQDEHERLLIDRLNEAGASVERETEFIGSEERGDRIVAQLERSDGRTDSCEAAFLAGCDGAHSRVRETLSIGFAGGTYEHLFYVADVDAGGPVMNGEIHVALDSADFLAVFPLEDPHRARLVGTVRDEAQTTQRSETLSWDDVSRRVIEWMRIDVSRVRWFSTYRVHHRVADRFRSGRAFLLGDAGHVHSPVGGQGMNTGIGDAVNLAWKLAAVLRQQADPRILETYEPERIAFARRLDVKGGLEGLPKRAHATKALLAVDGQRQRHPVVGVTRQIRPKFHQARPCAGGGAQKLFFEVAAAER